jgi:hypothetical protein
MNASSLENLRSPNGRDNKDEKMDQIRELLVGESMRQTEARLLAIETRLRDLEQALGRNVDALIARIDALAGETDTTRRTAFETLSKSVLDLGEHIRRIAKE